MGEGTGCKKRRILLFGIFRYECNLKSGVKSENERVRFTLLLDLNF